MLLTKNKCEFLSNHFYIWWFIVFNCKKWIQDQKKRKLFLRKLCLTSKWWPIKFLNNCQVNCYSIKKITLGDIPMMDRVTNRQAHGDLSNPMKHYMKCEWSLRKGCPNTPNYKGMDENLMETSYRPLNSNTKPMFDHVVG